MTCTELPNLFFCLSLPLWPTAVMSCFSTYQEALFFRCLKVIPIKVCCLEFLAFCLLISQHHSQYTFFSWCFFLAARLHNNSWAPWKYQSFKFIVLSFLILKYSNIGNVEVMLSFNQKQLTVTGKATLLKQSGPATKSRLSF